MSVYTQLVLSGNGFLQMEFRLYLVQIQNVAAVIANKVSVGRGVSIKTLLPLNNAYTLYHSMLFEKVQIAIDRSKTQIRMGRF